MREAGGAHERLADYLLKALFDDDATAGMVPDRNATALYALVRERAGKSLQLDRLELSRIVRVGALNQLVRSNAWAGLPWSMKLELLPLASSPDKMDLFWKCLSYTAQPNVGRNQVRAWIQRAQPRLPGSKGRPRGLTITGGKKFVQTGVKLGEESDRKSLAESVRKAPAEQRTAFTRDLKETIVNLRKLLQEIETPAKK